MLLKNWLIAFTVASSIVLATAQAEANNAAPKQSATPAVAMDDDYLNERPADAYDPIEGFNRGIFAFNKGFDSFLLRPVSKSYEFIMPDYGQRRVTYFLDNLAAPVSFVNSVLQADAENTFVTLWRFIINSSFGVAGLYDMATEFGVPQRHNEDFGQTLATWGVGGGAYTMLPFFGPSNVRDTLALPINILSNPFVYIFNDWWNYGTFATDVVDTRTRLGKVIDQTYDTSVDPYATFRSLYLQRRGALILNERVDANTLEVKKK